MYRHTMFIGLHPQRNNQHIEEALERYGVNAYTLTQGRGYYEGSFEPCYLVDIVSDLTPDRVRFIAHMIGAELKQKEILVVSSLVLSHMEQCEPEDTGKDRLRNQA